VRACARDRVDSSIYAAFALEGLMLKVWFSQGWFDSRSVLYGLFVILDFVFAGMALRQPLAFVPRFETDAPSHSSPPRENAADCADLIALPCAPQ